MEGAYREIASDPGGPEQKRINTKQKQKQKLLMLVVMMIMTMVMIGHLYKWDSSCPPR